ncbi:hypothetical protein KYE062_48600 [Escherichia coli]
MATYGGQFTLTLVVDQNYTVSDAAKAMDVGLSTMTEWFKQLRDERQGKRQKPP